VAGSRSQPSFRLTDVPDSAKERGAEGRLGTLGD
jgi:hypothetical protein